MADKKSDYDRMDDGRYLAVICSRKGNHLTVHTLECDISKRKVMTWARSGVDHTPMGDTAMSDPGDFDPALERKARAVMMTIDEWLNPNPDDKKIGIAVLMFPFDGGDEGRRMRFMSNASLADMIVALKEFIANFERRHQTGTKTKQ